MKRFGTALVLLTMLVANAGAQSIQKYFGYYAGDIDNPPSNAISEFKDHINLYHIINWSGDTSSSGRTDSKQILLSELAAAKAAHLHAIIPAYPFVFQKTGNPCWGQDSGAQAAWNDLVQDLVSHGYIDTQNPDRSVVSAIYVVDEPNLKDTDHGVYSCLWDVNGAANPALVSAVGVIRSNPNTSSIPLASILAVMNENFSDIRQGARLFDWVGFDHYDVSSATWTNELNTLEGLLPNKKIIIVPGAQSVFISGQCAGTNQASTFTNRMTMDSRVVWLAPFVWFSQQQCLGVRDIPSLRATYTNFGTGIKTQGCASSKDAGRFCKPPSIAPILDLILND